MFDTVLVYENYPTDAAALSGADGLAITEVANRDYYHYPLTIQAVPGAELDLRVQYRTDVFDSASISTLTQRYIQVLVGMTTDPTAAAVVDEPAGQHDASPPRQGDHADAATPTPHRR